MSKQVPPLLDRLEATLGDGPLGTDVEVIVSGRHNTWRVTLRQKVEHGRRETLAEAKDSSLRKALNAALPQPTP